jgi:hypothetical protein
MNEQRARIDRAQRKLEKLSGVAAAVKRVAEGTEAAVDHAQDRKFGKRLFGGIQHGTEAWRRARHGHGLAGAVRRLVTDQAVHAELRSAQRDLAQAYERIAKRRGHGAITSLAKLTSVAGLASLAATPRVRERVSALIETASRKSPSLEEIKDFAADKIPDRNGAPPHSLEDLTKEKLYARAQEADIPGRSEMSKEELIDALRVKG